MAKWDLSKLPEGRKPLPDELVPALLAERDTLRAEVEQLRTQAVTVKPLEWVEGKFCGQDMFYADTPFGPWLVVCYSGRGFRWASTDTSGDDSENDWATAEEAKAAAQADYEGLILSAITARTEREVWNEAIEAAAAVATSDGCDFTASLIVSLKRPVKVSQNGA